MKEKKIRLDLNEKVMAITDLLIYISLLFLAIYYSIFQSNYLMATLVVIAAFLVKACILLFMIYKRLTLL